MWKRPGASCEGASTRNGSLLLSRARGDPLLAEGASILFSVLKAEKLNLIPKDFLVGPPTLVIPGLPIESKQDVDPHLLDGVSLGKTPDGLVSVGAQVWCSAAAPMAEQLAGSRVASTTISRQVDGKRARDRGT